MRKLLALWLAAALILAGCSTFGEREPQPDMDALQLYHDFISGLKSGKVVKTHYGLDSWFQLLSATEETILFTENEAGDRLMSFRTRYPVAVWNASNPSYYDGIRLFYQYSGEWFADSQDRYQQMLEPDYLGIPTALLEENTVLQSEVNETFSGYSLYLQLTDGNGSYIEIKGSLDSNQSFRHLTITYYNYSLSAQGRAYYHTEVTSISYSSINNPVKVKQPSDLDMGDIQFLTKSYPTDHDYHEEG